MGTGMAMAIVAFSPAPAAFWRYMRAAISSMEPQSERLPRMQQELNEWLNDRVAAKYGGNTCEIIVDKGCPKSSRQKCGAILMETYSQVLNILTAYGLDG